MPTGLTVIPIAPFPDIAGALREWTIIEQMRLANLERTAARMAASGELERLPGLGFASLRWRLDRARDGAELVRLLVPHETVVRTLDPALARLDPSMWPPK